MIYGSVCSGIEAATVAWHPLGWQPAFFSEVDAFPRAVLAHHYPDVPLHGDFTTMEGHEYGAIDVLVGGTPCQDFSIAGLRAGVAGDRGNLTLEFFRLAARTKPRWIVWENVPGILSVDGGRTFGAVLGALADLGYGFAYRVLDAQYFDLAQRRARVFVVGCLGDWRRAAAVLFEPESLLGHPAPSRQPGQRAAGTIASGAHPGGYNGRDAPAGSLIPLGLGDDGETARALNGCHTASGRMDVSVDTFVAQVAFAQEVADPIAANQARTYTREGTHNFRTSNVVAVTEPVAFESRYARNGRGAPDVIVPPLKAQSGLTGKGDGAPLVVHALRADGFDASEDGTGRGTPLVIGTMDGRSAARPSGMKNESDFVVAFDPRQIHHPANYSNPKPGDPCHPLRAIANAEPAIAFSCKDSAQDVSTEVSPTLRGMSEVDSNANAGGQVAVASSMAVRRLTPRECERLQGFPDDYTLVPYRNKNLAADGPRYKALGNSMAVPVMHWIGRRIAIVEAS